MIPFLIRVLMIGVVIWALWRLYLAFYPARRPQVREPDEWQDVLEAIDELPETAEPHRRVHDDAPPLANGHLVSEDTASQEPIESVIVHEAEMALSLVREGDENERIAAYYEIATYEKLCTMVDGHISEATRRKIGDIHQQALEMICPPDSDY